MVPIGPLHVIGVAYDSADRRDGVARAPGALREAGLLEQLALMSDEVVDRGDLQMQATGSRRDPVSGLIAPEALAAMIRSVRAEVRAARVEGGFPIVIGGDCPILLGCLGAWSDGALGLLFVDGHEDAWPPKLSTTGEAADMELGFALGRTLGDLPHELRAEIPLLDRERVVVVGARDAGELAAAGVPSIGDDVQVVAPGSIGDRGPSAVASESVARVGRGGSWWLHVDLDVLSSESLAAVGYPQPGGIGWEALTEVTRTALRSPGVSGWDVTIYDPDLDPTRAAARRIVRYIADSLIRPGWVMPAIASRPSAPRPAR